MDLPVMGLCPDRKRSINPFLMFSKSKNSIMFDKSGVVFETSNNCQTDYLNSKTSKFHSLFAKSYNQSPFITSFSIVGGFLGSKSQIRSTINQDQHIWDFIKVAENLFSSSPHLIKTSISKDQFATSSVPSPPKKKFAKEEPQDLETSESEFPSVDKRGECVLTTAVDHPKQSYAEVAKSVCSRPTVISGTNQSSSSRKERSASGDSHERRQQSLQRKSNHRKRNRRERRNLTSQSTCESVSYLASQNVKKEHTKQCKTAVAQSSLPQDSPVRNCSRKQDPKYSLKRNCWESFASGYRDHRPYFHSGIGRKRPAKSRSDTCDIEMVNWRTGEPIRASMPIDRANDNCGGEKPVAVEEEMVTHCGECNHESGSHSDHGTDASCVEQLQNYNRRRSYSSECSLDSEDSFIVFQSGGLSDSMSDISGNWSDMDSDDNFDDDSDSELEVDMCDGSNLCPSSQRLQEINLRWDNDSETPTVSETSSGPSCNRTINTGKKVHFTSSKPKVHQMLAWDYAYRSSRVGPWEEMARDRARFQCRIQQFEHVLSPVLDPDHRAKIWKQLKLQL